MVPIADLSLHQFDYRMQLEIVNILIYQLSLFGLDLAMVDDGLGKSFDQFKCLDLTEMFYYVYGFNHCPN